jgi:hypothetical protein
LDQQLFPQAMTNDEFVHQWQDMNASAFIQQSPDQNRPSHTLVNDELFDEQVPDLDGRVQTFFNQEPFGQWTPVQQMSFQQPYVENAAGQEISGPMWTQQSLPDQILMEHMPLQPIFMQPQGQMLAPQIPAPRAPLRLAPCHFSAPVASPSNTAPPDELLPGFDMCGRCNQPFEVARNRGTACYFHRG